MKPARPINKLFIFFLIFLLGLIFLPPKEILANWPMFRNSVDRTGASPYSIGELSPLRWSSTNLGKILSPPAVDTSGNIYIGTDKGLTKLSADGQKIWTKYESPSGSVLFDDNQNIYFSHAGCNPYVYSITPDSEIIWRYDLRQGGGSCGNNQSYTPIGTSVDKKTLYVGADYPLSSLLAFNLDGTLKWKRSLKGNSPKISGAAVASDGTIYIGSGNNGFLFALNSDGVIKWQKGVASGLNVILTTPLVDADNNVYVTTIGATGGEVLASYNSSGNYRWLYKAEGSYFTGNLALRNNYIYAVEKSNLLAIDKDTGLVSWKWLTSSSTNLTTPVTDKNGIIYTTDSDKLYSLNPDGSLKSEFSLGSTLGPPIIADNGLIYIYQNSSEASGFLHALGTPENSQTLYPVIFIPGIGGSEFKANQDIVWSKEDGHGGIYSHAYTANEKIWVNESEAIKIGDDDYFDVLRLKTDGQTSEADLALTGNLTSFGYPDIDTFFESLGYEKGKNFFIFPYDWRKDIKLSENDLNHLIKEAILKSGQSKVNIVAHSMGGLVARYYITDSEKAKKVNKLIGLGVPHLGSVEALKTIIYGKWLSYKIPLIPLIGIGIIPNSETKDLFSNFPSAFQLQPHSKYFNFYGNQDSDHPFPFLDERDIDSNSETGSLNFTQIKSLLSNLGYNMTVFSIAEQFQSFLSPYLSNSNGVRLYHIAGTGQPTLGQIKEGWWINWPLELIPKYDETYINGDETVPLYSASLKSDTLDLSAGAKIYYVEQSHTDLVRNEGPAMQAVKAILSESDALPVEVKDQKITLEGHHLSIDKDANLDLYDDNGNHTGINDNGEIETKIPHTFFDTLGDTKHLFVKKKASKVKAKITPKKAGKINLRIRNYKQDKISKTTTFQNIPVSNTTTIEFDLDPSSTTYPSLSVDNQIILATSEVTGEEVYDQTSPKTIITLSGNINSEGKYLDSVTISLTSLDNESGLLRIEYSLDNGQTVNIYSKPFTINTIGITTLKISAVDKLGNTELPQTLTFEIVSGTVAPTPSPTSTPSPTPTPTPTNTPAPSNTPIPTPTITFVPIILPSSIYLQETTDRDLTNIVLPIDTFIEETPVVKLASLSTQNPVLGVSTKNLPATIPNFILILLIASLLPGIVPLSLNLLSTLINTFTFIEQPKE